MNVTSTAVSLTVDDVPAGAAFLARHLGFREAMAADGFASLVREDTPDVILLRRGTEVLPEGFRDQPAAGVIIAFTVDDLDAEYERLKNEGAPVTMPLREEPWGERLFQITDPNGVVIQLVAWANPGHA
ncbi:VOC family protein [Streptomyces griseofuscus]|uniref:Glyoxalase n=1 Tax=Streptomyces griseofuscus TaxID=146922 RepID=A0A7H1PXI8_9ACTN|nr:MULTISPECIES: VOC family protein [Streptomyces]MBA9048361.1 putative enzyme related to lactoylglutathione lyase [Streptomyces murinus]QNT92768.1 glyoxalase [Streptomyces griseofuscus]BBC93411.1 glyoxalase [Streptomyces rochei]